LAKRIIPPLDVRRFAGFFSASRMLLRRNDQSIGFPKVGKAMSEAKRFRNLLPQFLTTCLASVADDERDHLPGLSAQSDPNPSLVGFLQNK